MSPGGEPRVTAGQERWPALPLAAWSDTYATLHLWLQIAGKVRLALSPWTNHAWHATLYVTPTGLTTSAIPCGAGSFEITFDFIAHRLHVRASDGRTGGFGLAPQTVADFYAALMRELRAIDVHARFYAAPNEVADPIPFARDEVHRSYDAEYANRFWRVLVEADRVLKRFRARFSGKCSPVHLFWGAPDLAVTRFSGRLAPRHPGGVPHLPDRITRDAYSHEVSSAGFWPGGGPVPDAAFYSYAYPEPPGFATARVEPLAAAYNTELREFILPYDAVRTASDPDAVLLGFLQSTYVAAADRAQWDRAALERPEGEGPPQA